MPRSSKRSRIKLAAPAYKALLKLVYDRDGWKCRSCKRRDGLNAHHIKFRSQGGDDALDNLITLCVRCHRAVHDGNFVIKLCDEDGSMLFIRKNGWTNEVS